MKFKKGIVLFDIHYPEHDKASVNIAYEFCRDFKPDFFILGGDQLDLNCVSFYNHGKPKLVEGQRLDKDYEGFQLDILDRFLSIIPKKCKKYWMVGNHEYRIDRYIESDPQFEGLIEPEKRLDLSKFTIIPFNEVLSIGHMHFIHGIYYNKYHSFKHLVEYEDNIFYGHTHSNQLFTKTSFLHNQPKQGVGVGSLCNKNPHYRRNRPSNWIHQFMYFYLLPDGTFTYYLPIIINNKCVINGKLYEG